MPNNRVSCSACKRWIERDDPNLLKVGICHYCNTDCFWKKKSVLHPPRIKATAENYRDAVIERDGGTCRVCGTMIHLHVHHCQYRSGGGSNEFSNLITLCDRDHDLVHSDKKRYKPLLLGLIFRREIYGDCTTTMFELERELGKIFE